MSVKDFAKGMLQLAAWMIGGFLLFALISCAGSSQEVQQRLDAFGRTVADLGSAFGPAGVATSSIITGVVTLGVYAYRSITGPRRYEHYAKKAAAKKKESAQ